MGCYIQGPSLQKADYLVREHNGKEIQFPFVFEEIPGEFALICVVSNGPFDAAGFAFNKEEFEVFSYPNDPRPKRWILIDRKLACELTGYKENGA